MVLNGVSTLVAPAGSVTGARAIAVLIRATRAGSLQFTEEYGPEYRGDNAAAFVMSPRAFALMS